MKPCQVIGLNSVSDNEKIKDTFKTKGDKNQAALQGLMTTRSNDSKMNSMQNSCVCPCTCMHICMIMNVCVHAHVSLSREREKNLDSKASTLVPQRLIYFSVYWCCYGDAKNHLGG